LRLIILIPVQKNYLKDRILSIKSLSLNDTTPWFVEQSLNEIFLSDRLSKGDEQDQFEDYDVSEDFNPDSLFMDDGVDEDAPNIAHRFMEKIVVTHWKHVIYNLLVDNHNNPNLHHFCVPYQHRFLNKKGELEERKGFRFDVTQSPQKKLAELWAEHEKEKKLEDIELPQIFKDDLYKYYLRACLDLLAKYFIKQDKFTFMYDDIPLFVPNGSLDDALARIKIICARNRKAKKEKDNSSGRGKTEKTSKKRYHSKSPSKRSKMTKLTSKIFSKY